MPQFRYQALNAAQQPVTGEVTADSLSAAAAQLAAEGLTVHSLSDVASIPAAAVIESSAAWPQHLARILHRGSELLPPLKAFADEQPAGRNRRQLQALTNILASEQLSISDIEKATRALPGYWIPLLSAATTTRDPGRMLREFLREVRQAEELRRQWWQLLIYPFLLLVMVKVLLVILSFLIIPVFRNIFDGFGIQIPLATKVVLITGHWIASGLLLLVVLALALFGLLLWSLRGWLSLSLREWWQDLFATRFGHSTAIARFTQFTADLLEAELSIGQALRLAGVASRNGSIQRAADRVALGFESTVEDSPHKNRRLLTRTVHYALVTPQSTTSRVRLLREISKGYTERMHSWLSWARGFIEPLAILLVGLIVLGVVVALFLPLIQLVVALS